MISRLAGAVLALLLGILAGGAPGTAALLTDTDVTSAGTFSIGTLLPTGTPTVAVTGLGGRRVTWTAANVDSGVPGQATINRYQVMRYTAATGGTGTQVCDITNQALTCDLSGQPAIAYYSVIATFQSWTAESGRGTTIADTTKPTITFTWPTNGYSAKRSDYDKNATTACGLKLLMACGTTSDDIGVTGFTYQLQRQYGTPTVTQCWSGTAWVTGTCGTTFLTANLVTTGTTRVWEIPGDSKKYEDRASTHTLTVRAVDAAGNTSDGGLLGLTPVSITFTSTN